MKERIHSLRSAGRPWQQSPHSRYRLTDNPDKLVRNLRDRFPKAQLIGNDKDYRSMVIRIIGFVEAPRIGMHLPLDVRGTAFQRRLWQALQPIPVKGRSRHIVLDRSRSAPL